MPHLDEGTLQAWLDRDRSGLGPEERARIEAHLEGCEACARSLEELEGSTARVEALLGVAPAAGEIPPFEAVRARAAGEAAPAGRARRRWRPTAWAASVAVALGVGWMANEMIRTGGAGPTAVSEPVAREMADSGAAPRRPSAARATGAVGGAGPEDGPGLPVARPAVPVLDEPAVVADASEEAGAGPPASGDEPRSVARSAAAPPPPPPGGDDAVPEPTAFDDRVAEDRDALQARMRSEESADVEKAAPVLRGRVTDASTGRPIPGAQVYVAEGAVGTLTDARGDFELAFADLPGDSAVTLRAEHVGYARDSARVELAGEPGEAVDFRLGSEALALEEMVVTGEEAALRLENLILWKEAYVPSSELAPGKGPPALLEGADAAAWERVSLEGAEARAGFEPWAAAGLPVRDVQVGPMGGWTWVRLLQELDDGGTLELYQARGPGLTASADLVDAEPSRLEWAVGELHGLDILARGPVTRERLEEILRGPRR